MAPCPPITQSFVHARGNSVAASFTEAMADFAAMGTLDIWYAHLDKYEPL